MPFSCKNKSFFIILQTNKHNGYAWIYSKMQATKEKITEKLLEITN